MDEIPLAFASNQNFNVKLPTEAQDSAGAADGKTSRQRLRRITIKNCEATVKLALRNDGQVLSPMIVVKVTEPDQDIIDAIANYGGFPCPNRFTFYRDKVLQIGIKFT